MLLASHATAGLAARPPDRPLALTSRPSCAPPAARRFFSAPAQPLAATAESTPGEPAPSSPAEEEEEEDAFTGLLPEEDFEVPGSPNDSMTSNTALGRAIGSACEELADLAALEAEAADAAAALLLKLGYKVGKGEGGKAEEKEKAVDETAG